MEILGKVLGMNTSDGVYNLTINDENGNVKNLKLNGEMAKKIGLGHTYFFEYTVQEGAERTTYMVQSLKEITDLPFQEQNEALRKFYPQAPMTLEDAISQIESYIEKIDNSIIKDITKHLIEKYKEDFFLYPAASRLHHAYVGGLAYHSIGMLRLADGFLLNYPYLDKNYIYAGIMLHDIGKTIELTGVVNTEYTIKGQLLGHLVLGAMEIQKTAVELGYDKTEESLILEHLLISHHGQPQFGSAKKPMTAEALALWYIDTIDSKFRVLGEELEKTDSGTYTDSIGVLDRTKIYKL